MYIKDVSWWTSICMRVCIMHPFHYLGSKVATCTSCTSMQPTCPCLWPKIIIPIFLCPSAVSSRWHAYCLSLSSGGSNEMFCCHIDLFQLGAVDSICYTLSYLCLTKLVIRSRNNYWCSSATTSFLYVYRDWLQVWQPFLNWQQERGR